MCRIGHFAFSVVFLKQISLFPPARVRFRRAGFCVCDDGPMRLTTPPRQAVEDDQKIIPHRAQMFEYHGFVAVDIFPGFDFRFDLQQLLLFCFALGFDLQQLRLFRFVFNPRFEQQRGQLGEGLPDGVLN